MKVLRILAITVVAGISVFAQDSGTKQNSSPRLELPELHTIKTVTLSPSYSCRSEEEFRRGYQDTALFLWANVYLRTPDLLFNGACGAADYFQASTAGDDMSLIADLGAVSLEEVSASRAFNLKRVHSLPDYSQFAQVAKVEQGRTYAVLLNSQLKRGLLIFTVVSYQKNLKVELRYAVKSYQILPGNQVSPGFAWDKTSR